MNFRHRDRFTAKEKSWIMYDWANSVYATNIMAAIFPTVFVSVVNKAGGAGDQWWGYGTSISTLVIAVLAPLLGAIADYKGMKKKLFTVFMLIGVSFTALIAMTNDWRIMLIGYVFSHIGFSGSCLFYDSFLTDVTTNDRMDKVSSWGFAMGYIGGSTIPFVISIAVLLMMGYSSMFAQKFAILITSLWWLAFSIPFVKNVRQEHYLERTSENSVKQTLHNVVRTARDMFINKGLLFFTIAYFFYIDGVGTVISISTAYGTALGLGSVGMILALLVTQIVAVPCSIGFSRISGKIGARKALSTAILIYTFICMVGFYMGFSLEPHQEAYEKVMNNSEYKSVIEQFTPQNVSFDDNRAYKAAYDKYSSEIKTTLLSKDRNASIEELTVRIEELPQIDISNISIEPMTYNDISTFSDSEKLAAINLVLKSSAKRFALENAFILDSLHNAISFSTMLFWMMAFLVGTVQGGIQAVSRSYFGKLVPKERSNEFFGFFDIFGKFAAVIGPLLYALISGITGRSSYGVLCLIVLFLAGFVSLNAGKKHLV